ncbi:MAG: YbhB/YbcL family Raf kinase inhibitor-like protein [Terriglobia bacterium]|jgi:Raf kinase inhibitor-like YbhB/YbcL family protein
MAKNARRAFAALLLPRVLVFIPLLSLVTLMVVLPARVGGQQAAKIELKTSSFEPGGFIPKRFTCEAADVSPALSWGDPPAGTQSFAIIVDDPDAPSGTFVHWLAYDLPAGSRRLPEALPGSDQMAGGGRQGTNDFSRTGYSGPCPPRGKPHRYFIRFYALDTKTNLHPAATRAELDAAMQGHILAQTELVGLFKR